MSKPEESDFIDEFLAKFKVNLKHSLIEPIQYIYKELPVQMTAFKTQQIMQYSQVQRLMGLTAITTGFLFTLRAVNSNKFFKTAVMSFYGFGLILFPEVYNNVMDLERQRFNNQVYEYTSDE